MRKIRVTLRVALFVVSVALAVGAVAWQVAPEREYKFAFGRLHRVIMQFERGPRWPSRELGMGIHVTICRNCWYRQNHADGCDWNAPNDWNDLAVSLKAAPMRTHRFLGATFHRSTDWSQINLSAPQWLAMGTLCSPLMLLTGIALIRWRRHHKRKSCGFCVACGYDLQGLPEPRCPECGTEFDAEPLRGIDGGG